MEPEDSLHRLSSISTLWSLVRQANQGPDEEARTAQRQLIDRYGRAIRRYLLGALRSEDAAEELFQEFALCLLRGDFRKVDSDRGRFRDYVKGVLSHLTAKHHKRQRREPRPFGSEQPEPAESAPSHADLDRAFLASWRDDLLARSWADLARFEEETGQPYYQVLRFRAEHPDLASGQMAEQLSAALGKPLTAAGVRQTLHRAREKFAGLLVEDVAQSLEKPTREALEQELLELGLLEYCQPVLQKRD